MWPELAGIYGDNFVVFFPQISFLSSAAKREAKPSFHVAPPADLAAAGRKVREMKRSHQKEPSALLIGRAPTAATAAPLGGSTPLGDRVIRNTAIRFTIRLCATSFDLVLFFLPLDGDGGAISGQKRRQIDFTRDTTFRSANTWLT